MERNEVVLVNMRDQELGVAEKMKVHEEGLLHRAFSVFLFREKYVEEEKNHDSGTEKMEVLLQKRASCKYHCGGLWTNTCCSHPAMGENIEESARKRLVEEMGIEIEKLTEVHSFVYRARFENGLIEFEYDHVLVGYYDGPYMLDPEEVDDIRWVEIDELMENILARPEDYTPWFLTAIKSAVEYSI